MKSEQIERIKIWLDCLKKDFCTPIGEVKLHRMNTYENLGFDTVHKLVTRQKTASEWNTRKQEGEPVANVFYSEYPEAWGRKWEYGWFYGTADLSAFEIDENTRIELIPDVGGEMLIEINGHLAGSRDLQHTGITLTRSAEGNESFEIFIEAYAGHGPRLEHAGPAFYGEASVPEPPHYQVKTGKCILASFNESAYKLYIEASALWQLYQQLDKKSLRAQKVLSALFKFSRTADFEAEPAVRNASYEQARKCLEHELKCVNGSTAPEFAIFGQSHLDLAWKWTTEETRRKCARTYSTQLALMDEYPEYVFFGCSPYIFESIRKDYPELFTRIKQKVEEGQIVPDGGMYVEADTNMPTGEALIRQILYAKQWYRQYFNTDTVMVWLPDCFGFSGQLPQIMRKSGIRYFSTQKLFRAQEGAEVFPYNDFVWEGIDGTEIPAHFYKKNNARYEVSQLCSRWTSDRVQDENIEEMMFPFGFGDGGGGATRDMLETARITANLEGCPKTHYESPVSFMSRLARRMEEQSEENGYGIDGVNLYRGELYLPWHRGTYTSQAKLKFANRKTEEMLREADLWCALAAFTGKINEREVYRALKELWIKMMFLQFHDVLPGTSIERVNEEAVSEFGRINTEASALVARAKYALCGDSDIIWNPIAADRTLNSREFTVPSCGYTHLSVYDLSMEADDGLLAYRDEDGNYCLENSSIKAEFDTDGRLVSCKYLGREYISAPGNTFRLYRDINIAYDAWELATYYRNEEVEDALASAEVTGFGIDRNGLTAEAYIELQIKFSESMLYQRITLSDASQQLEFTTSVDWHETHKLLRVEFPTTVNTDSIICETQYGYVTRPNHRSKKSDADRFEGCMHRYEALAADNYGVMLLNDCKYGCGAEGSVIAMTCLKAAKIPDMNADMGEHYFSYAFRPYDGSFAESDAAIEGMKFNAPVELTGIRPSEGGESVSFFNVEGNNVVLDWVKLAEDGSGDIILRVYESMNSTEKAVVRTSLNISEAFLCNMLEQNELECDMSKDSEGCLIELNFRPFEIKTIRLRK